MRYFASTDLDISHLIAPTGPFHGTSDSANAALAAFTAIVSGGFVASTARVLHTICVS